MEAMASIPKKCLAFFSNRVAIRRHSFSQPITFSTKWRLRYFVLSKLGSRSWFFLVGMTTSISFFLKTPESDLHCIPCPLLPPWALLLPMRMRRPSRSRLWKPMPLVLFLPPFPKATWLKQGSARPEFLFPGSRSEPHK